MTSVFWIGLILGGLISVVMAELVDLGSWAALRIVRVTARRIKPPELAERYAEEWEAELAGLRT